MDRGRFYLVVAMVLFAVGAAVGAIVDIVVAVLTHDKHLGLRLSAIPLWLFVVAMFCYVAFRAATRPKERLSSLGSAKRIIFIVIVWVFIVGFTGGALETFFRDVSVQKKVALICTFVWGAVVFFFAFLWMRNTD